MVGDSCMAVNRALKVPRAMLLLGPSEEVLGPGVPPDGVGRQGTVSIHSQC